MATTYCDFAPGHEWHGPYHEREYGFPVTDDAELFERLMLEINQAGLSWLTVLKKREAFRRAYHDFDPDRVAAYGASARPTTPDPRRNGPSSSSRRSGSPAARSSESSS
jgi:3-methyladenine DNA glycosylase Tag